MIKMKKFKFNKKEKIFKLKKIKIKTKMIPY